MQAPGAECLRDAAIDTPDGLAMVGGLPDAAARRRWTFRELLTDAESAARALAARVRPGERVAVDRPRVGRGPRRSDAGHGQPRLPPGRAALRAGPVSGGRFPLTALGKIQKFTLRET